MDTPKSSDLLQARLRERKAESARANKTRSPRPSGRDDAIFDAEPESPKANMSKQYQSSPFDSGRRAAANKPGSRRGSNAVGPKDGTLRAMGVREMEEHVDRLSKQNFDLKLEVYHRRERIEELEKKLELAAELEANNEELLEMNAELVRELEKRDVAVDEAVVMICDLEEKVRRMEGGLYSTPPSTAQPRTTDTEGSPSSPKMQSTSSRPKRTPTKERRSSRTKVSPEVSARLATLTKTEKAAKAIRPPSFIQDAQASTSALRSLFVDGGKAIRPIPSYASLLSRQTALEDDDIQEAVLQSPRLSVLSDGDLKSLYGQDHDAIFPKSPDRETSGGITPKTTALDETSRQRNLARVDRWVEDRVRSPDAQNRLKRAPKALTTDQFQSLGDVLHQGNAHLDVVCPAKTNRNNALHLGVPQQVAQQVVQQSKPRSTPPMNVHPVFGHTYFPPTPDTMVTHTLNHSTSSIVAERSVIDSSHAPAANHGSGIPIVQGPKLVSPHARPGAVPRHSMLPKEFDSYDDADLSDEAHHSTSHRAFQTAFGSDESTSPDSPRYTRHSPARSSPSPEQFFKSRRGPLEEHSGSRSRPPVLRVKTEPALAMEPLASPTQPWTAIPKNYKPYQYNELPVSLADSTSLLPETPTVSRKPNYGDFYHHQSPPRQAHPHQTYPTNSNSQFPTSPTTGSPRSPTQQNTKSPPSAFMQRSNSLRNRVARLTRRNSASTPSEASHHATNSAPSINTFQSGTVSGPEDSGSRPARKRSIKQRFFGRRSSSAHEPVTSSSTPQQGTPLDRHPTYMGHPATTPTSYSPAFFGLDPAANRAQIAAPDAYQRLKPTITPGSAGSSSGHSGRYFTPNSSADEAADQGSAQRPTLQGRGRSINGPNDSRNYSTPSGDRKRINYSATRSGSIARNAGPYAGAGSGSETEGASRHRSGSLRLRELDGTGAGGRWM